MTPNSSSGVKLCDHGLPAAHRVSRQPHSFGRAFFNCPKGKDDPNHCLYFDWDDASPGDEYRSRALVEDRFAPVPSSRPSSQGQFPDNMRASSGQSKVLACSSFKDTTSEPESTAVSGCSTKTKSHAYSGSFPSTIKRPAVETDQIGQAATVDDVVANRSESALNYIAQTSPRPRKKTRIGPDFPPREDSFSSLLPQSNDSVKSSYLPNEDDAETQETADVEASILLAPDQHKDRKPVTIPSKAARAQPMMFVETIQDTINALSIIPTYVRTLERQNSILLENNEINEIRLLRLENLLLEIKRQSGAH